jgi:hypothetical protein
MSRFTQIADNTFSELQTDAGVLLKSFDPENPVLVDEDIICATTGGINAKLWEEYTGQPLVFEHSVEKNGKVDHYLFFGMSVIHDYSTGKNIVTIFMTLAGMVVIMFIAVLFVSLISKMTGFVSTLANELSYR